MPEPALTIASLIREPRLQQACSLWLVGGSCRMVLVDPTTNPLVELEQRREEFDAVLLEQGALSAEDRRAFVDMELLMPAVVIGGVGGQIELHEAEVHLPHDQLEQLRYSLDAAVSRYLLQGLATSDSSPIPQSSETPDRWKLANRLKSRIGFVGVFYKRDPARFLRNLTEQERQGLVRSLERTYRDLLLSYFRDPAAANQALESFVNTAFFSDLPITKTVEIHMNLIDSFSNQLKLEGHNNNFLQDYRLALLDVTAHLCEMYRRSIPADAPLTGLPVQASGQPTMA
ncbi:MAG: circadian clock protein KaiA [Cyanobacteria bacterium]|nr:circadian clock protein KaiA [Cyanobacteriota bacterium]MDA1246733.1 circadian clock protein KaiA [Cyanobacteriota bacterium]